MLDFGRFFSRALAINIFFRRSFDSRRDLPQILVLLASSLSDFSIGFVSGFAVLHKILNLDQKLSFGISKADRQDLINGIVTFGFVVCQDRVLRHLAQNPEDVQQLLMTAWAAVPVLSILQFARNPESLKNLLRPIRVAFGPTSILTSIGIGILQVNNDDIEIARVGNNVDFLLKVSSPGSGYLLQICGFGGACCSFLAGFVFRPDNKEILNLITSAFGITLPNYKRRAFIHGFLNGMAVLGFAMLGLAQHHLSHLIYYNEL